MKPGRQTQTPFSTENEVLEDVVVVLKDVVESIVTLPSAEVEVEVEVDVEVDVDAENEVEVDVDVVVVSSLEGSVVVDVVVVAVVVVVVVVFSGRTQKPLPEQSRSHCMGTEQLGPARPYSQY